MTTSFLAESEGGGCTTIVLLLVWSERDGCMTSLLAGSAMDGCMTTALLAGSERDGCMTSLLAGSEGGGCKREGRLYDDCIAGWERG